ncbi:MAG: sulfotransferase [Gammaproteobacteria bacterium]|jgi:tetratricopeptide (TPR) repeat protein
MSKQNSIIRSRRKKAQTLFQENRLPEAREAYRQLCRLDRRDADAWFTLGLLNGQLGLLEEALGACREAIAIRPDFPEAYYNLARALQGLGRLQEAERAYREALRFRPGWPQALNNLGNIVQELGRYDESVELFRSAISIRGDYAEALNNLGNVLLLQGNSREALQSFQRAVALKPHYAVAHMGMGGALALLGDLDEALASYREAGRLDPSDAAIAAGEAALLERRGSIEQAYRRLQPYLEARPVNLNIANAFADMCDKVQRRGEAIALLENGLERPDKRIGRQQRITAHLHLGRLYERKGEYDKAFGHYQAGNDLKPHTFDRNGYAAFIHEIIATFDADLLRNAPRASHESRRPLFIVGMPRSGTTLVEQILASHPEVYGAGELADIREIVDRMGSVLGMSLTYPRCVAELTQDGCNRLAQDYLERIDHLAAGEPYVTDKMPGNFHYLGVIALLFPQARVIHCMRDPLDTCFSCYSYDFSGYHSYMYRLEDLGFYYRRYEELMRHWREVLPISMLDVSYETLVSDQERMVRELLTFCGLPWDERCLRHHENARFVNTVSYDQVRKPIYQSSIGRWRRFEAHLGPLQKALAG